MIINPHTCCAQRESACAPEHVDDVDRPRASRDRAGERGIGMLEVTVVLVLVMIIGGIAFAAVGNTRRNSNVTEARTAASNLGEAIEQFQRDHGGRLPAQPSATTPAATADWNASWSSPVDRANRVGTTPQPYLKQNAVEAFADRAVTLERSDGVVRAGQGEVPVRIRYLSNDALGLYALVIRSRAGSTWKGQCFVTNADATTSSGSAFLAPAAAMVGGQRRC